MTTITNADREELRRLHTICPGTILAADSILLEAFARHREQARREALEEAARVAERRMEERFAEFGVREWDTNATYYQGSRAETYEELDEEDEAIAIAIRTLIGETK